MGRRKQGEGPDPERWPLFTQSRWTTVNMIAGLRGFTSTSWSASLLIPSVGRDKLSPVMKSL